MLELIAFIGGIVILATGRVPHVLFGGDDTYTISEDDARVAGLLLLVALPLALCLPLLFPPGFARLVIRAAYYILIVAIGIWYRSSRFKRSVGRDGMLIGTTIPAEKAHIEETIAKKTYRSLLPMMLCITGIPALILGPLAMFRTRQAIKLSNEHQIGQGHRIWAYIILVLSTLGILYGVSITLLIAILSLTDGLPTDFAQGVLPTPAASLTPPPPTLTLEPSLTPEPSRTPKPSLTPTITPTIFPTPTTGPMPTLVSDTVDMTLIPYIIETEKNPTPSIALEGDMLVVGEKNSEVDGLKRAGRVQIYRRQFVGDAQRWLLEDSLTMPKSAEDAGFGRAIAVDGATLVVSSTESTVYGTHGAIYVFQRDPADNKWKFQTRPAPNDPSAFKFFGSSMVLHEDMLLVGASDADYESPRVVVFARIDNTWKEQAVLLADITEALGSSWGAPMLASDNRTLLVAGALGSRGYTFTETYIFQSSEDNWRQRTILPGPSTSYQGFSRSITVEERTIVTGVVYDDSTYYVVVLEDMSQTGD